MTCRLVGTGEVAAIFAAHGNGLQGDDVVRILTKPRDAPFLRFESDGET